MTEMKLQLFGPPRLFRDGALVKIGRRKAMALLAYLALAARRHSREELATFLWPEHDEASGRMDLSRTLSFIKRRIGVEVFSLDRETARLNPDTPLWVDVLAFQALLKRGKEHEHGTAAFCEECLAALARSVALYSADFMTGFTMSGSVAFDDWQRGQTETLRKALGGALAQLSEAHEARGEWEQALDYAGRWAELDPLQEAAQRRVMALYSYQGRHTAALRQYEMLVEALHDELGVAPQAETSALRERIERARRDGKREAAFALRRPAFLGEGQEYARGERLQFVARERELQWLDTQLNAALEGRGGVAFIAGEAGSGKSSLLAEFARRAQGQRPDLLVASGHCPAVLGISAPYFPFQELLGMLAGDVERKWLSGSSTRNQAQRLWAAMPKVIEALLVEGPDLLDAFVSGSALLERARARAPWGAGWLDALEKRTQQRRGEEWQPAPAQLIEQYTRVLATIAQARPDAQSEARPLLLLLDDLQWADKDSINLLFHLGRELRGSRVVILGAYRSSEVGRTPVAERPHPLKAVVNELVQSFGEIILDLNRSSRAESRGFVDAYLDLEPNHFPQSFREAFYQHTQGHPLFTGELLREMQARGDLLQDEEGHWGVGEHLDWTKLPARVEAVIEQRLGRLPAELYELLMVASVEGEVFTAEVVSVVQETPERTLLRSLSGELQKQHRLVREHDSIAVNERRLSRYRFSHALFRQYLYQQLVAGERRLLHAEIAQALEDIYGEHKDDVAIQLAQHYIEAKEREKAIAYLLLGGDRARNRYAYEEAIALYSQALEFLKEQGRREQAARTLMKLGQAHHQVFEFREARRAYKEGFALWRQVGQSVAESTGGARETLRIHWPNPRSLDPTLVSDSESEALVDQLFSGLLEQRAELDIVPGVAHRWEVQDEGCHYLFHLRDDVRWSDGAPVTAHDFAYAWRRFLDPQEGSIIASELYGIKGARDFHEGRVTDWSKVGIRVIDDVTLALEMEEATNHLPHLMALSYGYPAPKHVIEAHGERWTEPQHIVSNGPFRMEAWRRDELLILKRNPYYYGTSGGNVERVEVYFSPDGSSLPATMYANDELDVLTFFSHRKLPEAKRRFLQQNFADDAIITPWLLTIYLGFVCKHRPFDDPRVRQALVMAIDKERYAHVIRGGSETPALGGFIPPGTPGHSPEIGLPYDPEAAAELLAEAGYGEGRGFPAVRAVTGPHRSDAASFLREQWREHLGIDVNWEIADRRVSLPLIRKGVVDMYIVGWIADYPDPANYLARNHQVIRQLKWENAEFLALIDEAERTVEPAERMVRYREAERMMIERAAMTPLIYGQNKTFVKKRVHGYPISAFKFWYWKDVVIGG